MPTVGCEADAIAFTEEDSSSNSSSSSSSSNDSSSGQALVFTADGSYSTGDVVCVLGTGQAGEGTDLDTVAG